MTKEEAVKFSESWEEIYASLLCVLCEKREKAPGTDHCEECERIVATEYEQWINSLGLPLSVPEYECPVCLKELFSPSCGWCVGGEG